MLVKVCDAIMGTGKSQAAIAYMNAHPEKKFVYITPFLTETARIKEACRAMHFVEPSDKIPEYGFSKTKHTAALINEGRNISTTHQAFMMYSPETLEKIREQKYTLIIDEDLNSLKNASFNPGDMKLLLDAGYIKRVGDNYETVNDAYTGIALKDLYDLIQCRDVDHVKSNKNGEEVLFYWTLPQSLITAFAEVFVLTYLFKGQSLRYMFDIYGIPYDYIGVERTDDGGYQFCDSPGYVPDYVGNLKQMINILSNPRMNDIGADRCDLSIGWFERRGDIKRMKDHLHNWFNHIAVKHPPAERMWGTYKDYIEKLTGRGYTKGHVAFNIKATNEYRHKTALAYCVNVFMNVDDKTFYNKHGIEPDEDIYALSTMIQWIWRSAIRDGKPIDIYIPSARMRKLLVDWIDEVSKGVNT